MRTERLSHAFNGKQLLGQLRHRLLNLSHATLLLLTGLLLACSEQPRQSEAEVKRLKNIDKQVQQIIHSYKQQDTPDFAAYKQTKTKKQAFFRYLTPAIKAQNLLAERDKLRLSRIARHWHGQRKLSPQEQTWLLQQLSHYRVTADSIDSAIKQLKPRIGTIPKALVLAQAANESAWGTSRFARQGNNYFGQWCYSKGCGLVPQQRIAGGTHEVAIYSSVYESVAAYFRNLNSNKAYRSLRQIRQQAEASQQQVSAEQLAQGLRFYSERGDAYVADIVRLMRSNQSLIN